MASAWVTAPSKSESSHVLAHDNARSCAGRCTGAASVGGRNTPSAQAARIALHPPIESIPLVDFRISNGITAVAEVRGAIDGSAGWPARAAVEHAQTAQYPRLVDPQRTLRQRHRTLGKGGQTPL